MRYQKRSNVPISTLNHRALGRPSIEAKARRRSTIHNEAINPPNKNWARGFQKRHLELKSRRLQAMGWKRPDNNIHDKIVHWFDVIEKVLRDPAILPENVYNMDEMGVMLCMLASITVLVSRDDLRDYRGAAVKPTMVTAIECMSANGRSLLPMIICSSIDGGTGHSSIIRRSTTRNLVHMFQVLQVFDTTCLVEGIVAFVLKEELLATQLASRDGIGYPVVSGSPVISPSA
ncbi:uncharacterized protein RAG0_17315 [Rhynchosporium agropyri]|uniref:HTH CENPB-type domain-containing protein n=1 Tax=Rhynchosporium agropyri TaxID=914238 RepID=A0A1E1LTN8_9HELO|nr:uncharacterized protein RAG0_17315 [Rhynchosporium agropyri]